MMPEFRIGVIWKASPFPITFAGGVTNHWKDFQQLNHTSATRTFNDLEPVVNILLQYFGPVLIRVRLSQGVTGTRKYVMGIFVGTQVNEFSCN
jgi:hypothetical protein